jgi:hypothetical protein
MLEVILLDKKRNNNLLSCGRDLAEWSDGLPVQSGNSPVFNPSILRHSGVWAAEGEAVLNKEYLKIPL